MFEICDFISDHLLGEPATGVIARFCSPLVALLLLAGCSLTRSSRLPRKPQKRTLTPVQLRFLG